MEIFNLAGYSLWWHISTITCQINICRLVKKYYKPVAKYLNLYYVYTTNCNLLVSFYIWQVDIIIGQVDVIFWQVYIKIWHVNIITKKSSFQILILICQIFMLTCQILCRLVRQFCCYLYIWHLIGKLHEHSFKIYFLTNE